MDAELYNYDREQCHCSKQDFVFLGSEALRSTQKREVNESFAKVPKYFMIVYAFIRYKFIVNIKCGNNKRNIPTMGGKERGREREKKRAAKEKTFPLYFFLTVRECGTEWKLAFLKRSE